MKIIHLVCAIILTIPVYRAQQNLVPNGSFEMYRQNVLDNLNNADVFENTAPGPNFMTSHLAINNPLAGLFNCWESEFPPSFGALNGVLGISYGIMPSLFPVTGGTEPLPAEFGADKVEGLGEGDPRAYSSSGASYGLKLSPSPINGLLGMDCSPPNSKFGTNMDAFHGDNYFALIDFKHPSTNTASGEAAYPFIRAKLKTPLVEDKTYQFEITIAKMNLLGQLASSDGWGGTENPNITLRMGKSHSSGIYTSKQKIMDETFDHNDWVTYVGQFDANKDFDYIIIEMDPVSNSLATDSKISGCFIDNIKLYEACETPDNQCLNANYRDDLLDVKLSDSEYGDPLAYPDETQGFNDYLQTIKAENLENVERLEMKIFPAGSNTPIRVIDHWYPNSTYVWDGNDQMGNPMPEDSYKAIINAVSNSCYHITNADEKNFQLKRKYTVFNNVQISSALIPGNGGGFVSVPAIRGLEDAHWINIKVTPLTSSQIVYEESFYNPPSDMLLSLYPGNLNGLANLIEGDYVISVLVSNNCQSTNLGNNWNHLAYGSAYIADHLNYNVVDPTVFEWTFTAKPDAICPFNFNYADNYLPPRDCCEGTLYLDNVDINTPWTVNIMNDIFIGNNVTFSAGAANHLYAGQSIIVGPDVVIGPNTNLYPGIYNCLPCQIILDDDNVNGLDPDRNNYYDSLVENNSEDSTEYTLSPNPLTENQEIIIYSASKIIDVDNVRISMYSSMGSKIQVKILEVTPSHIKLKPESRLAHGVYFVNIESNGYYEHFTVKVE